MILKRLEFVKITTEKLNNMEKAQRQSKVVQRSRIRDVEFPEEEKKEKEQMQTTLQASKHDSSTTEEIEAMIPPSRIEIEPKTKPEVKRGLTTSPSKESFDGKSEVT